MSNIFYHSTRGQETNISASEAIVKGLAKDGGLYVPSSIPLIQKPLKELAEYSYQELACYVLGLFFTDFTEAEIKHCVDRAYDHKFDHVEIAPIVKKGEHFYLELFHGSTIAFKDMALSILPYLLTTAAKKIGIQNDIVILTATSGDTGKAALAGFADVEGTRIIVFYPKDGVSMIQERQMLTSEGKNTCVVGIDGNFDDAQNGVKAIFNDKQFNEELEKIGCQLSSANSINIGRLVPQVVYYVYTYVKMMAMGEIQEGDALNVVVPTGNFGNILAAFYAKSMGIPLGKLICASNDNKVLFDFFRSGTYDRQRDFILTISPSMDILISSNLERLLYEAAEHQADKIVDLMNHLTKDGAYQIDDAMKAKMSDFIPGFASEEETLAAINKEFRESAYVIDPHTAVAKAAYDKYIEETKDTNRAVIVSTASPYKFTSSALKAIDSKFEDVDDFILLNELEKLSGIEIPSAVKNIDQREILHHTVCRTEEMPEIVRRWLLE
ncbi:MAG: threonine synthase [Vallitaleaceae bacterium]|nr:threonine synthase [Vallitaleaceae bacterium]